MKTFAGPWQQWVPSQQPSSVTIGVLDGVHVGHRALISQLRSDGLKTVLTFDPHPLEVLRPEVSPGLLTDIDERLALFDRVGVDVVGVMDLREIRDLEAAEFVESILIEKMSVTSLTVGSDFRFGRGRAGNVSLLRTMGMSHGYDVDAIELVEHDGRSVSSSRIRDLVRAGEMREASALLGSRYQISGEVVRGDQRGRTIGFPTANLIPPSRKVIPGTGVYAAYARLAGTTLNAAVNVGVRPTFGGGDLIVEAFLIDFDGDIYGKFLTLEFVERLRPELSFEKVDDLVLQMEADVAETREILAGADPVVG